MKRRWSAGSAAFPAVDVDQGPVIIQKTAPVEANDTVETLAARVLEREHLAYPEAVRMMAQKILN